jgi:dihydroflavonol-4-reductase
MKRVFITGADGMLGSHLVRVLLRQGWQVIALVQAGRSTHALEGLDVRCVEGDVLDAKALAAASAGCGYFIHAAASTRVWPDRNPMVRQVNVAGTRNVLEVAKRAEVKRLVYVGSASSFGVPGRNRPGDERTPYDGDKYGNDYISSKYAAMLLVQQAAKDGLDSVIVCPTFMFGAYDAAPGSGAMILALCQGKIPGFTAGGKNYICAKDAAVGIAHALTMGRAGEAYLLGHENLSFQEAFRKIGSVIGKPPPRLSLPPWGVLAYAYLSTGWAKQMGKPPTVTPTMAKLSNVVFHYSSAKAIRELALPQTPIEEGVREAYDWFLANGYLAIK